MTQSLLVHSLVAKMMTEVFITMLRGAEIGYQKAALRIDAFFGVEFDSSNTYYNLGAEVGYTLAPVGGVIGGIEVFGGTALEYDDAWAPSLSSFYGGVHVPVGERLIVTARAANMDDGNYHYYTVGVAYKFGSGSRFAPRDFSSSFRWLLSKQ